MEPRCCELCEPRTAESINECVEDDIEGDVLTSFAVTIAATSNELVQTLRRERDQLAHVLGQSCSPFLSRQAILQRLRPPPSP